MSDELMMITPIQIRIIKNIRKRRTDIDQARIKILVHEYSGGKTTSLAKLTKSEAKKLIHFLNPI